MSEQDKFGVYHDGELMFRINEKLIEAKNVHHNLEKIIDLHEEKLEIYASIKKNQYPSVAVFRDFADKLTILEFRLQRLWGFSEDKNFHRFWETPKCTCPKMDNADAYPYRQYINMDCKLHGSTK